MTIIDLHGFGGGRELVNCAAVGRVVECVEEPLAAGGVEQGSRRGSVQKMVDDEWSAKS